MNWYCIYIKKNHSNVVESQLGRLDGVSLFNPLCSYKKLYRREIKEVVEELFPCYVFVNMPEYYIHTVKYTRGVKYFLGDSVGSPYIIEDSVIYQIKKRLNGNIICLEEPELKAGESIKVVCGIFGGMEGVFLEKKSQNRVAILLKTIGGQLKVTLEHQDIKRL